MRRSAPWASVAFAFVLSTLASGASDGPDLKAIRKAIEKSLTLIQSSADFSLLQRRCFTCHHGTYPVITANAAWQRGFKIDDAVITAQLKRTHRELTSDIERFTEGRFPTGQGDVLGNSMWLLKELGWKEDETTRNAVRFLLDHDRKSEAWEPSADRPPTVGSKFTTTFTVLQAIDGYPHPELGRETRKRRASAIEWLENTPSFDNEDMVSRLRTLHLVKSEGFQKEAAKLLKAQREDGGWAQLPQLNSGPYATGTALAALIDTGVLKADSETYQRGVAFLLQSQKADGSWFVQSRVLPRRPFYQSLFPHKHNQFISISASSWATYALLQNFPVLKENVGKTYLQSHPQTSVKVAANR